MLYRIQTIYLLIVIFLSCIAINKYPFILYFKDMHYDANNCKTIKCFYFITFIISLICIFFNKKILYQKYINILNICFNFFIFIFIIYKKIFLIQLETFVETFEYNIINLIFTILVIIILLLINKNISKDIRIINSINRLR